MGWNTGGGGGGSATAPEAAGSAIEGLELFYASGTTLSARTGRAVDSTRATLLESTSDLTADKTSFAAANGVDRKTLTGTVVTAAAGSSATGTGTAFLTEFGTRAATGTAGTGGAPSTTVTGSGTRWSREIGVGDLVGTAAAGYVRVTAVYSDTSLQLTSNITLANGTTLNVIEQPSIRVGTETKALATITSNTAATIVGTWTSTNNPGITAYAGAIPVSSWANVYLITQAAGATPALLLSTQRTTPLALPSTYTLFRRLGAIHVDSAGNFSKFKTARSGQILEVEHQIVADSNRFMSGTATAETPVGLGGYCPPTTRAAVFQAQFYNPTFSTVQLFLHGAPSTEVNYWKTALTSVSDVVDTPSKRLVLNAPQIVYYYWSAIGCTAYTDLTHYEEDTTA